MGPKLCTGKWVKKIVSYGGVFDLAIEQPQLSRKQPQKQNKNKSNVSPFPAAAKILPNQDPSQSPFVASEKTAERYIY